MALLQDMYTHPLISEALSAYRTEQKGCAVSGYNTAGREFQIPGGILNAMIKIFLSEKIGIGVTNAGEIYTEVMGDSKDDYIAVLFNPKDKKIQACKFNALKSDEKKPLVSSGASKMPYFIAIPCIIHQRIQDKFKELEDAWSEIIEDTAISFMPKINQTDGGDCLIDSIVSGADEFPISIGNIENLVLVPGEVYDYTPELLKGKSGNFILSKAVPKPVDVDPFSSDESKSYQAQMKQLKDEMWPIVQDFYENLCDEDKALVPDEEQLGIYIPTPIFKNIVRVIADGLKNNEMDSQNVLLKGPPGVGKSVMAVAIAYVFSMPYRFTQAYKSADASEYTGTTIAENGVWKTVPETPFALTALRGGVHIDDDNSVTCC